MDSNLDRSTLAKSFDLNEPQIPIYYMRSVIFVFPTSQSYGEDKMKKKKENKCEVSPEKYIK